MDKLSDTDSRIIMWAILNNENEIEENTPKKEKLENSRKTV